MKGLVFLALAALIPTTGHAATRTLDLWAPGFGQTVTGTVTFNQSDVVPDPEWRFSPFGGPGPKDVAVRPAIELVFAGQTFTAGDDVDAPGFPLLWLGEAGEVTTLSFVVSEVDRLQGLFGSPPEFFGRDPTEIDAPGVIVFAVSRVTDDGATLRGPVQVLVDPGALPAVVPLPGGVVLLLSALGLGAVMARRRAAA